MNPSDQIKAFYKFLRQTPEMLRRVRRWSHYDELPNDERETVETHSLASPWLGAAMLAIELNHGRYTFDVPRVFRLMLAFPTHDMGEGKSGDVTYDVKNDDRVKGPLKEMEDEFVDGMYSKFPDVIRDAFRDAYAVEDEGKNGTTLEGRFFNAVERIGYMVFAVPQVRKHKRMSFVRVFRNHHAKLLELSQEFESVRIMYEPYIEFVEDTLRKADAFAVIDDDE